MAHDAGSMRKLFAAWGLSAGLPGSQLAVRYGTDPAAPAASRAAVEASIAAAVAPLDRVRLDPGGARDPGRRRVLAGGAVHSVNFDDRPFDSLVVKIPDPQ